jgi:hypothetical protein
MQDKSSQEEGSRRVSDRSWLAATAALGGAAWAIVHTWFTAVIVDIDTSGNPCSTGQSEAILIVTAGGVLVAALAGVILQISKRNRHALMAVGVEAVLVMVWIAAGGFGAFDCALDV